MAGLEHAARGRILEEYVGVLLQAWQGEPFEWRGRTVTVTPKPATVAAPDGARRRGSARRGPARGAAAAPDAPDEHRPGRARRVLRRSQDASATRVWSSRPSGPTFVHVADDPEQAWAEIGPYVLYEAQTYASYQTPGPALDARA